MEVTKPLITVITVVYNDVKHIEQTIQSVVNQTYSNLEYIIIDGGSTDGTVDVIKRYANKIAYWVSEPDKGIYDAMNKGIQRATGEWVNFMNSGDLYVSVEILAQFVHELTPNIRILRGNILRVYEHMKIKSVGVVTDNPVLMDMFNNTFHHQACLIQTSLFRDFGLYDTSYKLCSDWKFFFDCVVLHGVKSRYVNITVALFQMDGASSNNPLLCRSEQEDYLKTVYGEEQFALLQELSIYRKSKCVRGYFKLYTLLRNCLSSKNFNRVLTLKRMIRGLLRLNVN